jgi:hypothetical protein
VGCSCARHRLTLILHVPCLIDRCAVQNNETKWKDALIFLIDCSSLMQFPADDDDLREMEEDGKIRVKAEGSSIDTASGHHSSHDSSSAPASSAAAAASTASPPPRRARDPSLPDRSQFQMVLSVVLHSIRQKIISNPDDFVGVVLFGARVSRRPSGAMCTHALRRITQALTRVSLCLCVFVGVAQESQNPNSFPHIYIHTPLQNLTAGAIRKLDGLMDADEFENTIGSLSELAVASGKVEMDKILWICSSMFTEASVATATSRGVMQLVCGAAHTEQLLVRAGESWLNSIDVFSLLLCGPMQGCGELSQAHLAADEQRHTLQYA